VKRWLAAAAGLFGLVAYLRRRRSRAVEAEPDPADELRAKLAETRETPAGEAEAREPAGEPEAPSDSVEERRQDVHDKGRQALDELG
jgi:hypothetical protein